MRNKVIMGVVSVVLMAAACGVWLSVGSSSSDRTTPAELAAFVCSQLRDGTPESVVVGELPGLARERGVNLRETLREVERQCPELLAG